MKGWHLTAAAGTLIGTGMLLYGAMYEADRVTVERKTLPLPFWPESLRGYKVAVLADLHLRGPYTLKLCKRAVAAALDENPDMVVIPGDVVSYWGPGFADLLRDLMTPMLLMKGKVVAVPGNHDYSLGSPELLTGIFGEFNIRLLRNETWIEDGITWVGIDSAVEYRAEPFRAMEGVCPPAVCLWHEPDAVRILPRGCSLMISGHSHGGQFRFPGGFTPMHTNLGKRYPRGFYPYARTPLYVSRGIGTTGPPSRLNCSPEVSILTLIPKDVSESS